MTSGGIQGWRSGPTVIGYPSQRRSTNRQNGRARLVVNSKSFAASQAQADQNRATKAGALVMGSENGLSFKKLGTDQRRNA